MPQVKYEAWLISLLGCLICLGLVVRELLSVSAYSRSKCLIIILEVVKLIDEGLQLRLNPD